MVLRFLLRYLANNEKLIQMLADSYPMRKAARFTARMILQAKQIQEDALKNIQKAQSESIDHTSNKPVSSGSLYQIFIEKMQKLKKAFEDQSKQR